MRCVIPLFIGLLLLACSNQGTPPKDSLVPGRVLDLRVSDVGDSTVTLQWTAPGDDGTTGKAAAYDIRWQNTLLIEPEWVDATPAGPVPTPGIAGTAETAVLRGIPNGALRYFALKTQDEIGNWSMISNNDVKAWPGEPVCRVVPDSLDFGEVPVGQSFDRVFVISNEGGGTLRTSIAFDCGQYQVMSGGAGASLRHGMHQTVRIRFTPATEGEAVCLIDVGASCGPARCVGDGVAPTPVSMVAVETGVVFSMGSPATEAGRDTLDERGHPVLLTRPFLMGAYEVTQAEWFAVMGWNESAFAVGNRPVERVTWFDAVDFCNRLSDRDGYTHAYSMGDISREGNHIVSAGVVPRWSATGYRLPTEAEWEFACRAGTSSATFRGEATTLSCTPLDPVIDPIGWYCGNAYDTTHLVGRREASPWGLRDIFGNVFEWTWDRYGTTYGLDFPALPAEPDSVVSDPVGPPEGVSRVCRGGSYLATPRECRSAYRLYHLPGSYYDDVGFRVVRIQP